MNEPSRLVVKYRLRSSEGGDQPRARQYAEELERLAAAGGDVPLSAQEVVTAASETESPLHQYFEWDDSVAGPLWRLHQAAALIRSLYVVIEREERQIRAFFNVRDAQGKRGYVPQRVAFQNDDYRQQILHQALEQLKVWRRKYRDYEELNRIHAAIDETVAKIG
jgi:hypothetical protein